TEMVPPGSTLSLYPAGTRHFLLQFLAVLLVYVLARNNLDGLASLRRLSWLMLANGVALAFLALLQRFTSEPNVIYWSYASPGTSFGPFVCRNHFPFYMNVCLGMGLGLLLTVRARQSQYAERPGPTRSRRPAGLPVSGPASELDAEPAGFFDYLQTPWALWVAAGVTLILASIVLSLSRGGLVALLIGAAVVIVLRAVSSRRWHWLVPVILITAAGGLLLLWLGFDALESRYRTIWQGEVLSERMLIWEAAWKTSLEFPLTGTGGGTFAYVEPLHRPEAADPRMAGTYVHNEYLEALVEGGIPRLVLTLVLVGLVVHGAWRAWRARRGRLDQGLVLGGMLGLLAYIIQSAGDFGMHLPALALQATVLAALLMTIGRAPDPVEPPDADVWSIQAWGLAPLAGCVLVGSLALLLAVSALRLLATQSCVAEAVRRYPTADSQGMLDAAALLRQALFYSPDFARYRLEWAMALHRALELRHAEDQRRANASEAAQIVLALGLSAGPTASIGKAWGQVLTAAGPPSLHLQRVQLTVADREMRGPLLAMLSQLVAVRNQCPLLLQPHLRLAEFESFYVQAEPRLVHLNRAKKLRAFDPFLWFQCGLQEWLDGNQAEALRSWRRCLELPKADPYFSPIFEEVTARLPTEVFFTEIVADSPHYTFAAALRLFPKPDQVTERRPHLDRALALLRRHDDLTAEEYRLRGHIQHSLGLYNQSEDSMHQALFRSPRRHDWRLELAAFYLERQLHVKARDEVATVLAQQPNHPQALELQRIIRESLIPRQDP
ncbi:MAG TPA: O-antigen ligase family protein, partial [Gemmatales bacterium]|nr:O-antigen ligase family protein [Gemmatales bacterium]